MSEPAIFRAYPFLAEHVPWRPLGSFPTPIERVPDDAGIAPGCELWVKRDDACGPLYGGNKVRKLEFLLAEALARGRDRVVTVGGFGSHHVLATALYARQLGLGCDAVVFPQPPTPHSLQTLRAGLAAGCTYHAAAGYPGVAPRVARLRLRRKTAWIAPGGSSPIGTLGWMSAGIEIGEQISRGECPPFDVVYVALGSCGTAAGLWAGLPAQFAKRIIAVRVVDQIVSNRRATRNLATRTIGRVMRHAPRKLRLADPCELDVEHDFFGRGYGQPTDEGVAAMEAAARIGLSLETTYTGKTLAALRAHAKDGRLAGKRVLFVDTFSSIAPPLASIESILAGLDGKKETAGSTALPARLTRLFGPNSQNMT